MSESEPAATASRTLLSTRRLEAYTDGVFAIAATLLVLDLSVDTFGKISSSADLWKALVGLQGNLYAFAISFGLLSLTWAIHVRQFEYVERIDTLALTLNSARLFAVVLIPFTTTINGRYYGQWLGQFLLPVNFFLVVLFGTLQWLYISGSGRNMLSPEMSAKQVRVSRRGTIAALIISGFVVIASPWIGSWAFLFFFASNIVDRFDPDRLPSRKQTRQSR